MLKKLTAVLLALIFCLCAVGCSGTDPDAPEGMWSATVDGEPFTLYVPQSWTLNTTSGISSAFYSTREGLSVSARYYKPAEAMTKEAYLDLCISALSQEYAEESFLLTENKAAATLGGKDAKRISYEFKNGETVMKVSQITAASEGLLISLYLYCPKAEYEDRKEVLEEIRGAFKIVGKPDNKGTVVTPKGTPEGMKLASDEDIEYRFFVPTSWVCDPKSGASEAYYDESGRSVVTVTSYVPTSSMSVKDYFKLCEEKYKAELPEYTRIGDAVECKVDSRVAYSYTYETTVEGRRIRIMQTIFVHDSSFYTITYTALAEEGCNNFELHLDDVKKMLSEFRFR